MKPRGPPANNCNIRRKKKKMAIFFCMYSIKQSYIEPVPAIPLFVVQFRVVVMKSCLQDIVHGGQGPSAEKRTAQH